MTAGEPTVPRTLRRRRPQQSAEDVRAAMFTAAGSLVAELGVAISLEDLSMEDVIRRAGVPRSSVYRLWPYRGDFVGDLLERMAAPGWYGTAAFDEETLLVAQRIVGTVTRDSPRIDRERALYEACRQGAEANFRALSKSAEWATFMALILTVRATQDPDVRARVTRALVASETQFVSAMVSFYEQMSSHLGFYLKFEGTNFRQFTVLGAAVVEGAATRELLLQAAESCEGPSSSNPNDDIDVGVERLRDLHQTITVPAPGGGTADWTLPAFGFYAIVRAFLQQD